jgi:NAD(P)-dependent dehydrogenase (short-subunit alcohol dehydrogenase family)
MIKLFGLRLAFPVSLQGKTVWIIGASSGIGAALALQCAADGAVVAISARRPSALEEVLRAMPQGNHLLLPLDVTDMASFRRAFEQIQQQWQRIDYVVYAAGIRPLPAWEQFKAEEQLEGLDVNLGGVFRLLELMMPQWQQQQGGNLLLIGSLIATGAMPLAGSYGASKAGLAYLAENLRMDLESQQIHVQLVSPGFVDTPLVAFRPRQQMPLLMQPNMAAWRIRKLMGRAEIFEIHFPKMLSLPTRFLRWILPKDVWKTVLVALEQRTRKEQEL